MMSRICLLVVVGALLNGAHAQLILNEGNCVGPNGRWIEHDTSKPYEGFDYGVIPHSMNNNSPIAPVNPGNPFNDVDSSMPGVQMELPNGWTGDTGFARISENGGDWIELVVTQDFADLRGYTLYWENDDNGNGVVGDGADERGIIRLSNDAFWSQLRAGTIITISEDIQFAEVRDGYPLAPPNSNIHNTGFFYDLSTDLAFDPIGVGTPAMPEEDGDWHVHLWLNEGGVTPYFVSGADLRVDNDNWRMWIFDSTNLDPVSDKVTGLVQSAVGESAPGWGANTGAGGVNSQELVACLADIDPNATITAADYEDVDFSTFGRPNLYNMATEATLDGVQDFSPARAWLAMTLNGDSDYDGDVDADDRMRHFDNYTGPDGATDLPWAAGAVDGDGDIDLRDTSLLQADYTGSL